MVVYDHGEERSGIPQRLRELGVQVGARRLPAGDYVLSDRLAVMRLTESALVAALRGGRLFDRVGAMKRDFLVVVLMVQRDASVPPARGQRAALAWLLREGVSLLVIEDRDDAAAWIARLDAQERGSAEPPSAAVGPKPDDPDRLAEQLVAWLPGVSSVGARRLLGHFGSLHALFAADAEEIMQVRGFGPRRSAAIAAIARHRHGEAADDGATAPAPASAAPSDGEAARPAPARRARRGAAERRAPRGRPAPTRR
jgi:DNA excision repair protein ERCC-4